MIGDLTSNHSGDALEWFEASNLKAGTTGSAFYYRLDAEQRDYASWLGVPSLSEFHRNSPALLARFVEGPDSVVARWLTLPYSLHGCRIDVANLTGRRLARRDVRCQLHLYGVRLAGLRSASPVSPRIPLAGQLSTLNALDTHDGEHPRTPMPWDRMDVAAPTIDLYSDLVYVRAGVRHAARTDASLLRCQTAPRCPQRRGTGSGVIQFTPP